MNETDIPVKAPTFVIVGRNYWGKGETLKEAKRAYLRQDPALRLGDGYLALEFDADTTFHGVDGLGRYSWTGNPPKETEVKPT